MPKKADRPKGRPAAPAADDAGDRLTTIKAYKSFANKLNKTAEDMTTAERKYTQADVLAMLEPALDHLTVEAMTRRLGAMTPDVLRQVMERLGGRGS